jgi:hypothetical protein
MPALGATQEDDVRFCCDAVVVMKAEKVPDDHPHRSALKRFVRNTLRNELVDRKAKSTPCESYCEEAGAIL